MMLTETQKEDMLAIFYKCFANDTTKYLVPRMPFFDEFKNRQIIDLAILSPNTTQPRVAVLLLPPEDERTDRHYRNAAKAKEILQQQNWVPVIFTAEDLIYRPNHVKATLDDVYFGKPRTSPQKSGKLSYLEWLQNFISFIEQGRWRHADVVVFTAIITMVFSISVMTALDNPSYKTTRASGYNPLAHKSTYVMLNNNASQQEASPAVTANLDNLPAFPGKIIPVINLDEKGHLSPGRENAGENKATVKDPVYLATVLYCNSGIECQLKNDTRIVLWGVKLPDSPLKQGESMANLNRMLAGQQVMLEQRKVLPDAVVAKVSLNKQDVARLQVNAGLLLPSEEGDTYKPLSKRKTHTIVLTHSLKQE